MNTKKKFTLEDLKVDDLVTTLTEEEQRDLIGGHPPYAPTKCPTHCKASSIAVRTAE
ncbi:MAG: hypothetical protein KF850_03995 [Labilithrix sp.]|nr:hypothetical protein [Labilithrix sp.]